MKNFNKINSNRYIKLICAIFIAGALFSLSCHQTQVNETISKKMPTLLVNLVNSDDPISYARSHGITLKDGMVRVIITMDESITSRDYLTKYDLKDYQWRENFLIAYISVDELRELCKEPSVIYIRLPVTFDND